DSSSVLGSAVRVSFAVTAIATSSGLMVRFPAGSGTRICKLNDCARPKKDVGLLRERLCRRHYCCPFRRGDFGMSRSKDSSLQATPPRLPAEGGCGTTSCPRACARLERACNFAIQVSIALPPEGEGTWNARLYQRVSQPAPGGLWPR